MDSKPPQRQWFQAELQGQSRYRTIAALSLCTGSPILTTIMLSYSAIVFKAWFKLISIDELSLRAVAGAVMVPVEKGVMQCLVSIIRNRESIVAQVSFPSMLHRYISSAGAACV